MSTFGRTLVSGVAGFDAILSADGRPDYKAGGVTIDWSTVTAVSGSDVTLNDGTVVKIGNKYLRYGQVLCKITTQPVQTITMTGTGGTFRVAAVRPDNGNAVVTSALAYNVSAANMLSALQAVLGTDAVATVALAAGVYTITFNTPVATVTIADNQLTGGTAAVAVTTAGLNVGQYGPYDPSASDGRQTLTRGQAFLLNKTALQNLAVGFGVSPDDNAAVIEGGLVWKSRIIQSGTGAASLAAGPTFANLNSTFPRLRYAETA